MVKSEKEGNGNRSMEQMRNLILNLREIRCPSCLISICTLSNTATNGMKVSVFKFFDLGRIVIVIARCTEVLADKNKESSRPNFFQQASQDLGVVSSKYTIRNGGSTATRVAEIAGLPPRSFRIISLIAFVPQTKFLHQKKVFWVQKNYLQPLLVHLRPYLIHFCLI